ncbi:AMP-binding protein [Nocardioides sp. L-11A]|uniref:AMP-binding protein n=1 Tax=Nocardioides sp. L-11A TaxID=3043848 RepID=UPI002499E4E1|nr:AMP-binding protein [Nocardioides sp. L-11A]
MTPTTTATHDHSSAPEPPRGELGPLHDLAHAEATAPDRPLLAWREGEWTVAEFAAAARSAAAELHDAGVRAGDRVALMATNSAASLAATYGVWMLGAVEVAVNAELKGPLLAHVLRDSAPALLVVSATLADTAALQAPQLSTLVLEELRLDRSWTPPGTLPGPGDLASLLYTSGTTGPSKGVMIPHGYFSYFASVLASVLELGPDDTCYFTLPFFHVDAHIAVPTSLRRGSRMAFVERFSVRRFWSDVEHFGATWFGAVGSMLSALATQDAPPAAALDRLRVILAAPIPSDAYAFFEDTLQVPLLQMYGQTEANGPIYSTLDRRRRGAMGWARADFDLRVVTVEGADVEPGQVGELLTRPRREHIRAQGYWRAPEATATAFADGWFRTGDLVRCDADGFWYYAGRCSDSLRRRGENISAFELEAVMRTAPGVRECAAVAVRDELGGEDDIKAVLVASDGFDPGTFVAHCRAQLPRFALPRYLELVDEHRLVRGPGTGAVQKHLLPSGLTAATVDLEDLGTPN